MPAYNRFDKREDEKLKKLVKTFGSNNWRVISGKMYGRTARQSKDRYMRFLAPDINRSKWTREEDSLLLSLAEVMNHKWQQIALHFNNRNNVQCRNRYLRLTYVLNKTTTSLQNTQCGKDEGINCYIENTSPLDAVDFDFDLEFDDTFNVFEPC